ncbi:MAG: FHA domain-containing protein [Magnetococcales bacterium]|nr:FHA domain-containing protein [Magnetococcales bacterium]
MNRLSGRSRHSGTATIPQILFHIQEPDCSGYDFHYHLQERPEYLIGRAGLDHPLPPNCVRIALQDSRVSRNHCRIFLHSKGFWMIEDLGSTNGTHLHPPEAHHTPWLKVVMAMPLPDRSLIRVGQTLLAVRPLTTDPLVRPRWTWKRLLRQAA